MVEPVLGEEQQHVELGVYASNDPPVRLEQEVADHDRRVRLVGTERPDRERLDAFDRSDRLEREPTVTPLARTTAGDELEHAPRHLRPRRRVADLAGVFRDQQLVEGACTAAEVHVDERDLQVGLDRHGIDDRHTAHLACLRAEPALLAEIRRGERLVEVAVHTEDCDVVTHHLSAG